MVDVFKHLFDYIFVKTKRTSARVLYSIAIIIVALFVDDYLGISKNIRINQRLEQLGKLKSIDPAKFETDLLIQNEIELIKARMLDKSNFLVRSTKFISNQFRLLLDWRSLSASFVFLLGMLVAPLIVFSDTTMSIPKKLGVLLISELLFLTLSIILIKMLGLIPDLKYVWINHVINWLVQILIVLPFSIQATRQRDNKATR